MTTTCELSVGLYKSRRHAWPLLLLLAIVSNACIADRPTPLLGGDKAEALTAYVPGLWSDRYILVCWEQRGYAREKELVREAVESAWMRYSRLVFADWGDCDASKIGIHITLENGVDPTSGAASKYGWPRVEAGLDGAGRRNRDVRLSFDFQARAAEFPECVMDATARDACIRTSAVHEVGHALGFLDEQQRANVPVQCENKLGDDCPALDLRAENERDLGPFDHDSIMAACSLQRSDALLLTPNDIFYLQQAYDRKASGVLVAFDGRCLDFGAGDTDGSGAQVYECLGGTQFAPGEVASSNQHVHFDPLTSTVGLVGSQRVLSVPGDDAASGMQLQLAESTSAAGQRWELRSVVLRSMGGMCVRPITPSSPMFSELVLAKCNANQPQPELLFSLKDNGTIVHKQSGLCLHATGMSQARLQLQTCNDSPNQKWAQLENGALKGYGGMQDLCVDVGIIRNDLNRFFGSDDYNRLQLYSCNGQTNQMFSVAGPLEGLEGKCVEVAAAARNNGVPVRLAQCNGRQNQVWELYW